MAWALWTDPAHRGAKLHLHFDVLKGIPIEAKVTPGACSEPGWLRAMLQPDRLYVVDRGYADFPTPSRDILDAKSSFQWPTARTIPPLPWPRSGRSQQRRAAAGVVRDCDAQESSAPETSTRIISEQHDAI